jgi:hypothetical protein
MTTRWTTAVRTTGAALVIALGLGGCGLGAPEELPPTPTPTTTVDAPVRGDRKGPPKPDVPLVWPLTGVETGKIANRPAVSVKVENAVEARPQRGLVEADIVWEEVVEGGITRFVATYHSKMPSVVEPVRSVRPMDPAIVAPLDGILAFSGGQGPFIAAVQRYGTQILSNDDGDPGFARDPGRPAPHNVIGNVRTFAAQADAQRTSPPPAQFQYARKIAEGTAPRAGKTARTIDVRLSPAQRSIWTWDPDSNRYLRSEGSAASVAVNGARHSARNVLVLNTVVFNTNFVDPAGAPVPEHRLAASGGIGTLYSMGKGITVRWSKKNHNSPIVLKTRNGQEAELSPGNTWIELVPAGSGSWSPR